MTGPSIYNDVYKHMSIMQDEVFFIIFTNNYFKNCHIYLMKFKHEALEMFKEFKEEVEKQLDKDILAPRSDLGREYCKGKILDYIKKNESFS